MQLEGLNQTTGEANLGAINRNLRKLDAMANMVLQSVTDTTQPQSSLVNPSQVWWLPLGAVGTDWTGHGGELAVFTEDGWHFVPVWDGCHGHVVDEAKMRVYTAGAWNDPDVVKRVVVRLRDPQSGDVRRAMYLLGDFRITRVIYGISQNLNFPVTVSATPTVSTNGVTIVSAWVDNNNGEEFVGTIANADHQLGRWVEVNVGTVVGDPFMIAVQIHYIENVGI